MKIKILVFLSVFSLSMITVFAQQLKVEDLPPGLTYEFQNRFPGVENVSWSLQNDIYFADFMFMGNPVLSQWDKTTKWIGAETIITTENLPRTIQRHYASEYPKLSVLKAKYIEKRTESGYYIVEATEEGAKRFLFYDKDGVFQRMADDQDKDIVSGVIKTEPGMQAIAARELPTPINSYVMINYGNFRISESYLINNDEWINTYYIILTNNLEKENIQLWFDFKGNLIKKDDPFDKNETTSNNTDNNNSKKPKVEERKPLSETMVPQVVRDAFNKKVKKHEDLRWDTIKGLYVASYLDPIKREYCRAEFKRTGEWIQTFAELDSRALNQNIVKFLDENYPYLKVYSAESLTRSDRKRFILIKVFDPQWLNDPMVYHELYFNQSGRLENEIYADFIDPYDVYEKEDKEARNQYFLEFVDSDDLTAIEDYKQISPKELPTRTTKHIKENYPEHRINECYIMTDDFTGETVYWVILKKEGIRTQIKAVYNFKGNFIEDEEF